MSGLDPFPTGQVSLLAQQKNPLVPDYPTGLFSSPVSVAKPRGARGNDPTIIHKEGESQERENFLGVARTWSIVQKLLLAQQENPLVPDYRTDLFSSPASVAKPRGARVKDPTMIHKEGKSQERDDLLGVARTWSIVRQVNSYAITPGNPTLSTEISDSRKIHVRCKNRQMY